MRAECLAAASGWRLVLPGSPLAGRSGERLGRGTGSSLEFVEFRDYVPGDDLRHVDWRAYARTDQVQVRLFREEVAPSLDVVVDLSPSMAVTTAKGEALRDLVESAVYWSQRAGGHARRLAGGGGPFERFEDVRFEGSEDWLPRAPLRPRTLRMVVSDFLVPEDPAGRLRLLAAGAAHLYVLHLLDAWEAAPGEEGECSLVDCEDGSRLDVVLDRDSLARYRARLGRLREAVVRATRAVAGTYALVTADAPARMFRDQLLPQGVVEPA